MKSAPMIEVSSSGLDQCPEEVILTILRVYNNGDRVEQVLPEAEALREIEFSRRHRPGTALFIGSECVQYGYLGPDRCAAISADLAWENDPVRPYA